MTNYEMTKNKFEAHAIIYSYKCTCHTDDNAVIRDCLKMQLLASYRYQADISVMYLDLRSALCTAYLFTGRTGSITIEANM